MAKTTHNNYWTAIIAASLFPLLLWLASPASQPRFGSASAVLTSFGQMASLVGVILFAINLLLAARLRFFETHMNGLNNVYVKHSLLGQIAFILLLFHPLLLLSKYAPTFSAAASFLLPGSDWAITWGILALWLMIILIVLTLYLKPRYDIWKWTHKFLGLAFFLAALHVWFIPSDTSNYLPLKIYVLLFMGLGLAAFLYRSVFGRFLVQRYRYKVISVTRLNTEVTRIQMKPIKERLVYGPGQFVFLNFINSPIGLESHPFSLTSSPDAEDISVTVKNLGDYTKKLRDLAPGTIAEIEGPFGLFSFKHASRASQIWIAGGIGITPFISMVQSLTPDSSYCIDLFYCTKNESDAVYLEELKEISRLFGGVLRIIPFFSDERGRITAMEIKKTSGSIIDKDILICAPPPMITSLKKQLIAAGSAQERIFSEEFNL